MRQGAHVDRFRTALHVQRDPVVAALDHGAGFGQLVEDHVHAARCGIAQHHVALGHGAGDEEGAGLDAVRHDRVFGAVQALDALDDQLVAADALDLGAHRHQAVGEVDHFRLARGVFQDGGAFGQHRRHHQVFGAADGDHVHHDVGAAQFLGARLDVAMLDGDLGAHGNHALDVLFHRTRADGAAAG